MIVDGMILGWTCLAVEFTKVGWWGADDGGFFMLRSMETAIKLVWDCIYAEQPPSYFDLTMRV
jgi:hypothetical protein